MTKDFMKRDTMIKYTAYDIGCSCYTPKHTHQLKKMFKRAARRNAKKHLINSSEYDIINIENKN